MESLQFDISTIRAATHNFSSDTILGKGGFGEVYKVMFCRWPTLICNWYPMLSIARVHQIYNDDVCNSKQFYSW